MLAHLKSVPQDGHSPTRQSDPSLGGEKAWCCQSSDCTPEGLSLHPVFPRQRLGEIQMDHLPADFRG